MKRNVFLLFTVLLSLFATKASAEAYVVWCEGNTTLYFLSTTDNLNYGGTYDGQTITNVWKGKQVTNYYPLWKNNKVTRVVFDESFKEIEISSTSSWFMACTNLQSIAGIENLNTEKVTDMSSMFYNCKSLTSLDVSHFNTANVTTMYMMFAGCTNLKSLNVSNFNTENVTNMSDMFSYCESLTSIDVSNFNTSKVTDMSYMFSGCKNLTSLDLSLFNTESVTKMSRMFSDCESLTSIDVSNFNTVNVTNMYGMFSYCESLTSLDLGNFNTANVTDMWGMFSNCDNLKNLDLSNFNTANVTNMRFMFSSCSSLTSLDLSNFNTEKVTDMSYMFSCPNLISLDISNFNTVNVTNMGSMFSGCKSLTNLDLSSFNTSNVTNMSEMFLFCVGLTSLDLSNFNTANVTDMSEMFSYCENLESLDVSNFNTAKVKDMSRMFDDCHSLTTLDVSNFNTVSVKDMSKMFEDCHSLTTLDLSSFNTDNVTNVSDMFSYCKNLRTIFVSYSWNLNRSVRSEDMFFACYQLVGEKGSNSLGRDGSYAHIDGGRENPGYLSSKEPFIYEIIGEGFVAVKGCRIKGDIAIEPTVAINGKTYQVTAISNSAFRNNKDITSITIPNGVTTIGICAFYQCSNLVSITIPNSVTEIGGWAFIDCSSLTSVTIPNGVTEIDDYTFSGCSNLTSVFIGESVTSIDWSAFSDCTSLTSLTFGSSLTFIDYFAFDGCPLTSVNLIISDISAWCNTGQKNYHSRFSIHHMFLNGNELHDLVIPDNINKIGEFAFFRCEGLKSVSIGNHVDSIGAFAFSGCKGLNTVSIGDNVVSIGDAAFNDCYGLRTISIGNNVRHIGADAYWGCSNLSTVNISDLSAWCNINFENESSNPLDRLSSDLYLNDDKINRLVIPNNVTSIKKYAFCNYDGIEVTIPHHVTTICDSAFYQSGTNYLNIGCGVTKIGQKAFGSTWLRDVYCYADKIPSIANDAFDVIKRDYYEVTLHVPAVYINNYKTAEPYKNFKNIVAMVLQPYNVGQKVNFAKAINKYTCLDGFMVDSIFYSINNNDGAYDTEKGCIILNKATADATVKDLLNKDIFTKEFRNDYTGIVMKLAPGSGYLNVDVETIGDISLKVKIGNDAPKEMIPDGKQTASFQYNVNDETYVYIYASENTPQARNLRSGSADSSVMLYNIEISDSPNGINSITTSAENTLIFDLQGIQNDNLRKGVNIIRMKDGKTKKVVVK